mgnify:CR=1 FL=1
MKLHELSPAPGSTKKAYRVGRGAGSGNGKTAGKGHKGQKARSGGGVRPGFEGGQMPLQRRVPKFGFKNINRVAYKAINVSMLQALAERDNLEKIDRDILIAAGLLNKNELLKVLGDGSISAKLEITANAFSKSAIAAIEAAGGSVVVL